MNHPVFTCRARLSRRTARLTFCAVRRRCLGSPRRIRTHTPNFGVKLTERLAEASVCWELDYFGAADETHPGEQGYLIKGLPAKAAESLWP